MTEAVVNLFLFVDTTAMEDTPIVTGIGAVWHQLGGTDAEKLAALQSLIDGDLRSAKRYPLPNWCVLVDGSGRARRGTLTYETYTNLNGTSRLMELFEDAVFQHCPQAPRDPLMVVTPVVDGRVRVDEFTDIERPAS